MIPVALLQNWKLLAGGLVLIGLGLYVWTLRGAITSLRASSRTC